MKRFMKLMAVVGVLSASQLVAMDCCNWDWCDCPGDFYGFAEALYWKPTHCPVPYAQSVVSSNGLQVNKDFLIKNDYEWGVRVGIGYINECFFAELNYLWIRPTDCAKTTATELQGGSSNSITQADSRLKTQYQNVDLRVGQYLMRTCGCDFYVYGNARWIDLKFTSKTKGIPAGTGTFSAARHDLRARTDGGGLGVGLGGNFDICSGFGINGRFGFMGIIADTQLLEHRVVQTDGDIILGKSPTRTCILPALEFRLGVNYTYECGCWSFTGEIGYEFDYYLGAMRFSTTNDAEVSCQDIGFGGPYFRLQIGF